MNYVKIYLCAGLFIFLSAVKFCFPEQSSALRQQVRDLVEKDEDYSQKVEALGKQLQKKLADSGVLEAFKTGTFFTENEVPGGAEEEQAEQSVEQEREREPTPGPRL